MTFTFWPLKFILTTGYFICIGVLYNISTTVIPTSHWYATTGANIFCDLQWGQPGLIFKVPWLIIRYIIWMIHYSEATNYIRFLQVTLTNGYRLLLLLRQRSGCVVRCQNRITNQCSYTEMSTYCLLSWEMQTLALACLPTYSPT